MLAPVGPQVRGKPSNWSEGCRSSRVNADLGRIVLRVNDAADPLTAPPPVTTIPRTARSLPITATNPDTGVAGENETKSFDVLANDTDVDANDSNTLVSLAAVSVSSSNAAVDG